MADVYEVTIITKLLTQGCASVFHYLGIDNTTSRLLCDLIITTGLPVLQDIMGGDVSIETVHVANISVPGDTEQVELTGYIGNRGGLTTTSFVAWGFRKLVSSGITRSGSMRVPGVAETDITDGVADVTHLPRLNAWADFLATQYQDVAVNWTLVPVVIGRSVIGSLLVNLTTDASYNTVTSQNSRKLRTSSSVTLSVPTNLTTSDIGSPPSTPSTSTTGINVIDLSSLIGVPPPYSVVIEPTTVTPI